MGTRDPRVDAYIAKQADFARPILEHLREVVHAAVPDVEEAIKWGAPHFLHHGMLAGMAAFKAHATFGLWRGKEVVPGGGEDGAMGQFGRLGSIKDLPSKKELTALLKAAAKLNAQGVPKPAKKAATKKAAPRPSQEFAAAIAASRKAAATFAAFAPSCQREYVEWIDEAKRDDTRARRIAQAVEWLAEGKKRHWKYENC
jgi:hypothetical protein